MFDNAHTTHRGAASVDLLLPLRDVVLIAIEGHRLMLTGYEAKPDLEGRGLL